MRVIEAVRFGGPAPPGDRPDLPLRKAAAAHAAVENRMTVGKTLLLT